MLLIGYLLLALVVAAVLFYLVVALLPSGLTVTPIRDNRPMELPSSRRIRVSDLDRIRIPVSVRGYRFRETDELIDRLAAEIQVRDEEIDRLKQQGLPFRSPEQPEWAVRDLGEQAAVELAADSPRADDAGGDKIQVATNRARRVGARRVGARRSGRDGSAATTIKRPTSPPGNPTPGPSNPTPGLGNRAPGPSKPAPTPSTRRPEISRSRAVRALPTRWNGRPASGFGTSSDRAATLRLGRQHPGLHRVPRRRMGRAGAWRQRAVRAVDPGGVSSRGCPG